jgi:phosphoribosyl 1,2-cyclic phosphodiesterase
MNIRLWGTRGSIPSPGPSTVRYGGNTSCVEIRLTDGSLLILDAGTGIRCLGSTLGSCRATVLLSHYHWDHIQGLPFFGPAYDPESKIRILGPEFNGEGPDAFLQGQMLTPYFPAPPSQLEGMHAFEVTPSSPFRLEAATICSTRVCHPGVTLGYRIEERGEILVYISDNEPDLATPGHLRDIVALAEGADLLIHDCQYSEGEYAPRHGWGHATPRQAVRLATLAKARRLMLFHHDPSHTDEQIEALAEEAKALAPDIEILIGREGWSGTPGGSLLRPLAIRSEVVPPVPRRRAL